MSDITSTWGSQRPRYDGFISYSHAVDGRLAPKLETAVRRFAKPWYGRSRIKLFRDETSLSVTPALWPSIEAALSDSRYLILLASPTAAQSPWVQKEVSYWLEHRGPDSLLMVVTEGEIGWNADRGDFDWTRTTALPAILEKRCAVEPLYLDLRKLRETADLSQRNPEFRDAVARLAARLHGRPLEEMYGEDVRQHHRFVRVVRATVAALVLLTATAVTLAVLAVFSRNLAERRRMVSVAQALAAHSGRELEEGADPERAALLARQAYLFDRDTGGSRLAQVDAALREVVDRPHFGVTLSREGQGPGPLAFSRDGRWLAVAERAGVRVWDRPTRGTVPLDLLHDVGDIRALLFESKGDGLLALGARGLARWGALQGKAEVLRPISSAFEAGTLGTTSEGHVLAAIVWQTGVELVRVTSGRVARAWRCCETVGATLSAVAIGRSTPPLVATGDVEGTVRLWKADESGSLLQSLTGHGAPVASLAFDERGEHLAVGTDLRLPNILTLALKGEEDFAPLGGQVTLWDLTRRTPTRRVLRALRTPVSAVAISSESKLLAGAGGDGSVRLWRSLDGGGSPELIPGNAGPLRGLVFTSDGQTLAGTAFGIEGAVPAAIRLWRTVDLPGAMTILSHGGGAVRSLCFLPGENVLVSTGGGTARIWDLERHRMITEFPHAEAQAVSVACGTDGRTVATGVAPALGSSGFEVRIWDRARPKTPTVTLGGHASSVDAVALSPDGRWLASAGALEPEVHVRKRLDLPGAVTRVPTRHGQVRALAFSPDSRLLAWGDSEGWIGLGDAERGFAFARAFAQERGPIRAVAFSQDGALVASAGESGEIVVRSMRSDTPARRFSGHRGEVNGLVFAGADDVLVSAGDDGTVRLWELKRKESDPRILAQYARKLLSVAVSPDGAHVVAGGSNGEIFVWPATDRLAEAICAMPWRNLRCAEWTRFVGEGVDYVPTCPELLPRDCAESH